MRLALVVMFCGTAAQADVLGLNDYDALFDANPATALDDGSQVLELGDVQVLRDRDNVVTLDRNGAGAVGCFARILAQAEAYQAICDTPFDADQMGLHASYLEDVLAFYGANTHPEAAPDDVRAAYDALVEQSQITAQGYCTAGSNVQAFFNGVLRPETRAQVDALLATPRLPAENPCF